MFPLPFNQWTLQFQNPIHEKLFEEEQNEKRLCCFRYLTLCITILTILSLIVSALQQSSNIVIIGLAVIAIGSFTFLILSRKLINYLKLAYSFLYIWTVITSILITKSGIEIPQFVYGYYTSSIVSIALAFSANRIKLIYIISTPFILTGMYDLFTPNNFSWVIFSCFYSLLNGILVHINEYTARQAFSLNLINQKQQQIINEFVIDSLFALSFDERSQQFSLEFSNNPFKSQLMNENIQIKEFLRNYVVIHEKKIELGQKYNQQIISLEEFLFQLIKIKQEIFEFQIIECIHKDKKNNNKLTLKIKKIDYNKSLLVISIESEQLPKLLQKYEQKCKDQNDLVIMCYQELEKTQLKLDQELKKLQINNNPLKYISCMNFKALNQIRNFQLYFLQNKLHTLDKNKFNEIELTTYIKMILPYFQLLSIKQNKQFYLKNLIEDTFIWKINFTYITQILLNMFHLAMYNCQERVTLEIVKETNINPLQQSNMFTYQSQELQQTNLSVIKFNFIFQSQEIQSNNIEYQTEQCYTNRINKQIISQNLYQIINMNNTVSNLLIELLGPYKRFCHKQIQLNKEYNVFLNEIIFYIYSDQTQIETSYIKNYIQ